MVLKIINDYPASFPPKQYHVQPEAIMEAQAEALKRLVSNNCGETEVDNFLKAQPALLAACMNFTQFGHHGTWVVPQQLIRPPGDLPGLKPDFIVGGKGSDGYSWYVVELKAPRDQIFKKKRMGSPSFSKTTKDGISQLLNYIDYCSSAQAYLRDTLELKGFREPKGILVIGRETELIEDEALQNFKAAFNRTSNGLQVRTYDALVRSQWATSLRE